MAKKKKLGDVKAKQFAQKYYDPAETGSYGGVTGFVKRFPKSDRLRAKKWLESQDTYALHKPFVRKFKRRKVIANFQEQLQADLVDLVHISKDNDKYRYLLTVIDVFSKKAFVEILRKKDSATVAGGFEKILDRLGYKPRLVNTDQGKEFTGSKFQALLKSRGIKYFTSTDSTIKCSIVERFNRTLMSKLYRFFTKHNSYRYVEALSLILQGYNKSTHSAIGLAPTQVSHENKERVWLRIHNSTKTEKKRTSKAPQLKPGDFVRIAKRDKTFDKGYKSRWSGEIFKIYKIKQTAPKTYNLVDLLNEPILGAFYAQELNPTALPKNFAVESVLDSEKGKILVKWRDYPAKFNSWLPKNYLLKNI